MNRRSFLLLLILPIALAGCATAPGRHPDYGRLLRTRISGTSMEPVLALNEIVAVIPIPYHKLRVGHIVVRACNWTVEGRVAHRIIAREGRFFVTKGDASLGSDPGWLNPGNYIGMIVADKASARGLFQDGD